MWVCFSEGLSLRLRFFAFGVLGVGGASGRAVSASLGAGAVVEVEVFGSVVAEALGSVRVDIGAIMRVGERVRVLGFRDAVLELRGILTRNFWRG